MKQSSSILLKLFIFLFDLEPVSILEDKASILLTEEILSGAQTIEFSLNDEQDPDPEILSKYKNTELHNHKEMYESVRFRNFLFKPYQKWGTYYYAGNIHKNKKF